jgi:hypothetical protein
MENVRADVLAVKMRQTAIFVFKVTFYKTVNVKNAIIIAELVSQHYQLYANHVCQGFTFQMRSVLDVQIGNVLIVKVIRIFA